MHFMELPYLFKEVGLRASERDTPRQCVLGKRKERTAAILSLEGIIPGIYSWEEPGAKWNYCNKPKYDIY